MRAERIQLADSHSRTRRKRFPGRRHQLPRNLQYVSRWNKRFKRAWLTCVSWCCAETTHASRVCYLADVEGLGGNIERSAAELHGYGHVRVAWDYHLQVNQFATLTNIIVIIVLDHKLLSGAWAEPGILL